MDQQSGHVGRLFGLEVLVDAILASRNMLGRSIEIACRFYDLAEQVIQLYNFTFFNTDYEFKKFPFILLLVSHCTT